MKLKLAILLAFCCSQVYTMAQPIAPVPVQFSGVVISEDGSTAISFASVQVLNKRRGTVADENGFFSFVAMAGDTIQFSALGYTTTYTLILVLLVLLYYYDCGRCCSCYLVFVVVVVLMVVVVCFKKLCCFV